jgi:cyclopropane fatty-acyl-phospholipid synthase-like methyltransferase
VKRFVHAAEVNRDVIWEVFQRLLPGVGNVLEIGAGSGQHAVHFAREIPSVNWYATDFAAENVESIQAWRIEAGLPNVKKPRQLDVTVEDWEVPPLDAVVAINVTHASPWRVTVGLVAGAANFLQPGGRLLLYGPFIRSDRQTARSNQEFDASLKREHPDWGLRELDKITALATPRGLELEEIVERPSNNVIVAYQKPWRR